MFSKIKESQISRAIVGEFNKWFEDYIVSDVIVIGGVRVVLWQHAI